MRRAPAVLASALVFACPAPEAAPADSPVAAEAPPARTAPGGGPEARAAAALPVVRAEATRDGEATPLSAEGPTAVDPSCRFRVEVAAAIPEARLALYDAADAMVPSAGSAEIGLVSRFTLAPERPLRPGAEYVLRIDGAAGMRLRDAAGRVYRPLDLAVRAGGASRPREPRRGRSRRR